MSGWWIDETAPWRESLAAALFPGVPDQHRFDTIPEEIVHDHRLAPWIHANRPNAFPNGAEAAREAMALALFQQQALCEIVDRLSNAGIVPVLLKGTPLSLFAYDQPWQRPMRDLDLLVSPEDALDAYELLLSNGFRPVPGQDGDPAALLGERHQLPVLLARDDATFVELHLRLFHDREKDLPVTTIERTALGRTIRTLTPEGQLLHLVGHAARDHRFDNGPQVIVDLALLWQSETIDPERLPDLARAVRLERHTALLLAMAGDAFPEVGIASPFELPSDWSKAARGAWRLMTSPSDEVGAARDRQQTAASSAKAITARLLPSPTRLASRQGRATGPLALARQYGRHYVRLVIDRLPAMLVRSGQEEDLARLIAWLEA